MADGKTYLNLVTGEIIFKMNKWVAYKYFKADGKKFGYKIKVNDVLDADEILKEFSIFFGKKKENYLDGN